MKIQESTFAFMLDVLGICKPDVDYKLKDVRNEKCENCKQNDVCYIIAHDENDVI